MEQQASQESVGFTEDGARRVAGATIVSERGLKNPPGKRGRTATLSPLGFWAKIIGNGANSKYSWVAVKKDDLGDWEEDDEWGAGEHTDDTGYAEEARYTSQYVLKESIVWMMPTPGQDFYTFEYQPGIQIAKIESAGTISARDGNTLGEGTVRVIKVHHVNHDLSDGEN